MALLIAPLIETVMCQWLPVAVACRLGAGPSVCLVAAWLPFAAMHFASRVVSGLCAGMIGGFYFAFTYEHWRVRSTTAAVGMTWAAHFLHNALVCSFLVVT